MRNAAKYLGNESSLESKELEEEEEEEEHSIRAIIFCQILDTAGNFDRTAQEILLQVFLNCSVSVRNSAQLMLMKLLARFADSS